MYIYVLLIALLTSCCMSDQYVRVNDECMRMFNLLSYLHHGLCQLVMSDLMMNVHICVTDNITYTFYSRSL